MNAYHVRSDSQVDKSACDIKLFGKNVKGGIVYISALQMLAIAWINLESKSVHTERREDGSTSGKEYYCSFLPRGPF